jgi:hypothetical protein
MSTKLHDVTSQKTVPFIAMFSPAVRCKTHVTCSPVRVTRIQTCNKLFAIQIRPRSIALNNPTVEFTDCVWKAGLLHTESLPSTPHCHNICRYSDGLRAWRPGFDFRQCKIFLFSTASRPTLSPTHPMGGVSFPGGKSAGA